MRRFDVLIVGSGPGGQRAAFQASKLKKTVAVIERQPYIGGAGLHTGTLPSKTLREAALFLSGFKQRAIFGFQLAIGREVTLQELMHRKMDVIKKQMEVIIDQFSRNNVEIIYGDASFTDGHKLTVKGTTATEELYGDIIIIATGTRPLRPRDVPFDEAHIYDTDTILKIDNIPRTLAIIGGGVIGCEYACIFASLGVKVTLIEKKSRLLPFADEEIVNNLIYWMRHSGITLRLSEEVVKITVEAKDRVVTTLKSSKQAVSEKLLYTMGRVGNTDMLNLNAVGIKSNERGGLNVNENFQTALPHIYAIGDVIGFPALASTSMDQGRRAVCNAFHTEGVTCEVVSHLPFGIYTIPEISMVGETEEELTKKGVPYEIGCALFQEVAKGQIIGDTHGMLKLLFHRETRQLLGVHIIGERATELIHIGQAVMSFGGTIDYFKDTVFNYPTLTDAYKVAALNGLNRL
ncbi:MAG TPA: Si-specific NAD(P)(+) transhydrogenase [Deltaproteobacteria bacterium]|nr:MAG: NAD(P)(+) transhydrogenase [Deltaproteobacteria bacterium GWA2_43_19]OGQ09606.1 MAG: NAD(P)(+) transhydrogenase [Deltaproteobacteria bacterium RIFCSPHIGHO2_02_FULL_43_33]HBR18241.1 Si-specific NAD(P)(+) transhydrogenase [Deltaproteobacteria bacterium]